MSPEAPLRVGVVGVGYLGQHHARIYGSLSGVELVGVADVRAGRAAEIAARLGVEAFDDHRRLLGRVDAVSIATPTAPETRNAAGIAMRSEIVISDGAMLAMTPCTTKVV